VGLPRKIQNQVENYFEYRWAHNKNNAVSCQQDIDLLEQLPIEVQKKIFCDFLFRDLVAHY